MEASAVPVDWHGWLHHMHDVVPEARDKKPHFMKKHKPNMTGTDDAWLPRGSALYTGTAVRAMGHYRSWSPSP
ncbi:MAG: hypothetical protein GDA54_06040 [Alphaproteobacteria bacterium GM7ARS4]|nr:hypothetical protein [Alphaproteobacteria bacterium GM7ARS4]